MDVDDFAAVAQAGGEYPLAPREGQSGSTGDAYDNSMAESFVDSFKTELVADRVWRTRSQLELAIVEYIAWFNDSPPPRKPRRPATERDRRTLRCK